MNLKKLLAYASALCTCAGLLHAAPDVMNPEEASAALNRAHEALERNPDLEYFPNQVLVRFTTTDARLTSAARSLVNARLIRTLKGVDGLEHLETDLPVQRAIDMLNALPFVEYAEPDYVIRPIEVPNDTFIDLQWGIHNTGQTILGMTGVADQDIDGFEAWDTRTSAAGIIVAVIDSGTQWDHPDLDGNIWSNADEIPGNGIDDDSNGYIDDVRGWDFFSNDNNPDDGDGHGTHVAGTVGAEGDNGIGVAGVAWDVQIMPLRFIGPFGGSTSDAIAAVNYAVNNGAQISNNSWGGGGFSTSLRNAISNAAANNHLFVAAAGNDGLNTDTFPHYPSSYNNDNIISVAAIDNQGILVDNSVWASNYGATSVDLAAPGNDIASTYPTNSYAWSSGTSMASPHVAGAAAIIWAQNPGWTYAQVRDRLFDSTVANASLAGRCVTGGVLNLDMALEGGDPPNTPPQVNISSPANGSTFTEGNSVSFSGSASDSEDGNLSAFLVWTSSLDGPIGTGASFSTSGLSVGSHTITASVSDTGGLPDSDSVSITIEEDAPSGTPPATPGRPFIFNTGGVLTITWDDNSNNEDGFDVRRQERVDGRWTNNAIIGSVGENVTSFDDTPGNGRWRYRVRAFNDAGNSSWSSWRIVNVDEGGDPPNTPPSASISAPGNGSTFTEGDSVGFVGSASDDQDGNLSGSLEWSSDLDGVIGNGASFSTSSLSVGTHTITASVTDSGGLSASDSVIITIEQAQQNTAPSASISSPGNGSVFIDGDLIGFAGSASDNEDGNLSASLVWTSNLDGPIGTGASFMTNTLSVGTHTITASVTDSGGLMGSDSIVITIDPDQPSGTPPATPGRPSVVYTGGTSILLFWDDNSNNENGFEIRRQERVGNRWSNDTIIGAVGANVTSFDDDPGSGRWRYRVRAFNDAGDSSWSSWRIVNLN